MEDCSLQFPIDGQILSEKIIFKFLCVFIPTRAFKFLDKKN